MPPSPFHGQIKAIYSPQDPAASVLPLVEQQGEKAGGATKGDAPVAPCSTISSVMMSKPRVTQRGQRPLTLPAKGAPGLQRALPGE